MEKCRICNGDLYEIISFENIFKNKYSVHTKCYDSLIFNNDRIVIPITNNIIYYDCLFLNINANYNSEYLEAIYMGNLIYKNMKNRDWSVIIYYEEGLFDGFLHNDMLILFSLSNFPFLLISYIYYDLSIIVNEKM